MVKSVIFISHYVCTYIAITYIYRTLGPLQQHTFGINHIALSMQVAITKQRLIVSLFLLTSLFFWSGTCTFTISNQCTYTIWPGTLGTPQLPMTGFELAPGESIHVPSVPGWSGRIWARTGCTFDASGAGACRTGDCGGKLECGGIGATPPASLFEITMGQGDEKDFYDVSFVDGYNLPLVAAPRGVDSGCNATGCATDINIGMHLIVHYIN